MLYHVVVRRASKEKEDQMVYLRLLIGRGVFERRARSIFANRVGAMSRRGFQLPPWSQGSLINSILLQVSSGPIECSIRGHSVNLKSRTRLPGMASESLFTRA